MSISSKTSITPEIIGSTIATVRVGHEKRDFYIYKTLLCQKSKYFEKALCGSFLEAQTRIVELDDIHVVLFGIFATWLYNNRLLYATSGSVSAARHELEKLFEDTEEEYPMKPDEEDEYYEGPVDNLDRFDADKPENWPYGILARLYQLGDRLDSSAFKAAIVDAIIARAELTFPENNTIRCVFGISVEGCPLRRLFIHLYAYELPWNEGPSIWRHMPIDFLTGVMVTMGRRLPWKLCRNCFKDALDRNCLLSREMYDMTKDEDRRPYIRNPCIYHEHKTKEEQNVCEAERKKSRGGIHDSYQMDQGPQRSQASTDSSW